MTRVPTPSHSTDPADAQIDDAVMRLVGLFARQVARELAEDAPDAKEIPHAAKNHQED